MSISQISSSAQNFLQCILCWGFFPQDWLLAALQHGWTKNSCTVLSPAHMVLPDCPRWVKRTDVGDCSVPSFLCLNLFSLVWVISTRKKKKHSIMSHNILLYQTPFHLSDIWVSMNDYVCFWFADRHWRSIWFHSGLIMKLFHLCKTINKQ